MNCENFKRHLPEYLLEANDASLEAEIASHAGRCESCADELAELRATMGLLDLWQAPEPSPYFNTRMAARLREARDAAPAGLLERMRARMLFSSNLSMRPVIAGALALVLVASGGTYAGMDHFMRSAAQESATVADLQSLDRNAQTIDQMDQLLQDGQNHGQNDGAASGSAQ